MAKTVPAALQTHLDEDATAIASAWQIIRTDGTVYRFTNGSRDADLDFGDGDQTFSAAEGFSRSNIAQDSEMNVGNLDIVGIFDDAQLKEDELRLGLFDFADVRIAFYNMDSPSDGIIKMLRGQLAEVMVTPKGFFNVELRDLTQVFSKELGEYYSKDCRDDLGGLRCTVPLFPDLLPASTALTLGDYYRIPTAPDPADCTAIIMNFEGADGATSGVGFANDGTTADPSTIAGTAQIDTAVAAAGGDSTSSLLLDGNSDYVAFTSVSDFNINNSEPVTISCHFRPNTVPDLGVIASQYSTTSSNRVWFIRQNGGGLNAIIYQSDGVTADVTFNGGTTLIAGQDYHVEMVRKTNGDWVLFLDGVIEAGPTTPASTPKAGGSDLIIGAIDSAGISQHFDGWVDSFEFLVGFARHETTFTPPTGNLNTATPAYIWEDFGDRIYEVTTAGTTVACTQTPDTVVNNTHSQGTAVLTALNSFMRFAEVVAVDGTEPRRKFTVSELTPNTGYAITDATPSALGFADDFFNNGQAYFESGNNAGRGKEVKNFVADDGVTIEQEIELWESLPFDVVIGDKLKIYPGCDKTHAMCLARFNNAINFVGEPFVPGSDTLGDYPDARSR